MKKRQKGEGKGKPLSGLGSKGFTLGNLVHRLRGEKGKYRCRGKMTSSASLAFFVNEKSPPFGGGDG